MKLSARFSRLSLGRIARSANVVLTLLFVLSLVLHFRVPIGDLLSLPITAFSQARVDAPYLPLGLLFLVVSMVVYIVRISLIWLGSERPHAPSQDPSLAKLLHMPTVVGLLMWLPRHIFDRFIDSSVHDVLRKLEPLGVVVAALALVYAALGLRLANQDSEARRMETQMTFRLMLDDDLATARAPYKSSMTSRDDPGETNSLTKSCGRDYPMSVISRDPLVSKLENFARFGVPLDRIDATFLPLRDLSLEGAELKSVGFAWSDLQGARFSGSKLENALFFCSGLGNAEFATTDANIRTRLRGADFRFATLAGADFSGADLRDVAFEGASLSGADFRNADLEGAKFEGAALDRVNFADSVGLSEAQVNRACFKRNPPMGLPRGWQLPPKKFRCPEDVSVIGW